MFGLVGEIARSKEQMACCHFQQELGHECPQTVGLGETQNVNAVDLISDAILLTGINVERFTNKNNGPQAPQNPLGWGGAEST